MEISINKKLFFSATKLVFLSANVFFTCAYHQNRQKRRILFIRSTIRILDNSISFLFYFSFHRIVLSQKNQYLVAPALAVSHQIWFLNKYSPIQATPFTEYAGEKAKCLTLPQGVIFSSKSHNWQTEMNECKCCA